MTFCKDTVMMLAEAAGPRGGLGDANTQTMIRFLYVV